MSIKPSIIVKTPYTLQLIVGSGVCKTLQCFDLPLFTVTNERPPCPGPRPQWPARSCWTCPPSLSCQLWDPGTLSQRSPSGWCSQGGQSLVPSQSVTSFISRITFFWIKISTQYVCTIKSFFKVQHYKVIFINYMYGILNQSKNIQCHCTRKISQITYI